MTDNEIETFCAKHLAGLTVGEWTAYWDFPGFLNLCTPSTKDLGCLFITATPDTVNGEPNRVSFRLDWDGLDIFFPDVEGFDWASDGAKERWEAAVKARLPLFDEVLAVIREKGADGLNALSRSCGNIYGEDRIGG